MAVFRVQTATLKTADELNTATKSLPRLAWHASEPVVAVLVSGHDTANASIADSTVQHAAGKSATRRSYLQDLQSSSIVIDDAGGGADMDNDDATLQQPSCFYIFNCYDQHLRPSFRSPFAVPEIERVTCFVWASTTQLHQILIGFAHGIVIALRIDVPVAPPMEVGTAAGGGGSGKFAPPTVRIARCALSTQSHTSSTGVRNLFVSASSGITIAESTENIAYVWHAEFAGQQPAFKVQLGTNEIFTVLFLFDNVAAASAALQYGGFCIVERYGGSVSCLSCDGKQQSKYASTKNDAKPGSKTSQVLAAGLSATSENGENVQLFLMRSTMVQIFNIDKKNFKILPPVNIDLQLNALDAYVPSVVAGGARTVPSIQWASEVQCFIVQTTHNELLVWSEHAERQQHLTASSFNDYSPTDSIYAVNVHQNGCAITALSLGGYFLAWKLHYTTTTTEQQQQQSEHNSSKTWTYRPTFCGLFAALNFTGVATKSRHEPSSESPSNNMLIVSHRNLITTATVKSGQLLVVRETDALSYVNKQIALIEQVPKRFYMQTLTAADDDGAFGMIQAEFDVVAVTGWNSTGILVGAKQAAFFELTTQEIQHQPQQEDVYRLSSSAHEKTAPRRMKTRLMQTLPIEARLLAYNGTHIVAITDKTLHAYADNGVLIDSSTLAHVATSVTCSGNRFYCFTAQPALYVVEVTRKEVVIEYEFELIDSFGDDVAVSPRYSSVNNKIAVVLADKHETSTFLPRIATIDVNSGVCAVLHLTHASLNSAAAGSRCRLGDAEQALILEHNLRPAAVVWEESAAVPILCVQMRPRQPHKHIGLVVTAYREETNEDGFVIQAAKTLDFDAAMVAAKLPYICFSRKSSTSSNFTTAAANEIHHVALPLFEGHEQSSELLTLARLHYEITTGRLEQAMRTLKTVESNEMWTTIAALCLKRPNVELARLCLGNMREALMSSIFAKYERNEASASVLAGLLGVTTGQYQQAFTIFNENHAVSEAEKVAECAPTAMARPPLPSATTFDSSAMMNLENFGDKILCAIKRKAQQCQQAYRNTQSALCILEFDKAVAYANEAMLTPHEFVRLIKRQQNLSSYCRGFPMQSGEKATNNSDKTESNDAVKRSFAHKCELQNELAQAYASFDELGDYVSCARIVHMQQQQQQAVGDKKCWNLLQELLKSWSTRTDSGGNSSAAVLRYLQVIAQMRSSSAYMCTYGMQLGDTASRRAAAGGEPDAVCETVFNSLQAGGYHSCAFNYALQYNIAASKSGGNTNRRRSVEQANAFDDCLASAAAEASPVDRLELAEHLESSSTTSGGGPAVSGQRSLEQAIGLYRSLNLLDRATRLAFDTGRHDNVELIAETINENTGTAVVHKCAQYFIENQQYERAAQVMAKANQSEAAVELLSRHKVPISQPLVDLLVPPSSGSDAFSSSQKAASNADDPAAHTRRNLVMSLAHMCSREGNDALAAKLFSQIGERSEALRALIKSSGSNNTEAVVRFAKTARQPDLYVMAANHLQQRLHESPVQYEKDIVFMLEKAHELPRLATFFHNCAEHAIDARHGYDKAYAYYQKAAGVLTKMGERASRSLRFAVDEKMKVIAIFNELIKRVKEQPGRVLEQLRKLLNQCGWTEGLRRGDVLVAMAKILYGLENDADGAARLMEVLLLEVKQHDLKAQDYVSKEFVQRVFEESGRKLETVLAQAATVASAASLKSATTVTVAASNNKDHEHSDDGERADEDEGVHVPRPKKVVESAPSEFDVDDEIVEDEAVDELM